MGDRLKRYIAASANELSERVLAILTAPSLPSSANIAFSGGTTPSTILQDVCKIALQDNKILQRLRNAHYFQVDERFVNRNDPRCNYKMLQDSFFNPLSIPEENIHPMLPETIETTTVFAKKCAQKYDSLIHESGFFDLIFLGIGSDGHTASLFPESKGLYEAKKFCIDNQIPESGEIRLTLTYPCILSGKSVIFIVAGANKSAIIKEVMADRQEFPVSFVFRNHYNITMLLDQNTVQSLV